VKIYAGDIKFKTNICTAFELEEYYVTVPSCEDSERKASWKLVFKSDLLSESS